MSEAESFVAKELLAAAILFEDRNRTYGEAYKSHGAIMKAFFPSGLRLESANDFTRFGVFNAMVGKLNREAANFEEGGHYDSMTDLMVFAAMMIEVDQNAD